MLAYLIRIALLSLRRNPVLSMLLIAAIALAAGGYLMYREESAA